MRRVLSQDEIDALFSAAQPGKKGEPAAYIPQIAIRLPVGEPREFIEGQGFEHAYYSVLVTIQFPEIGYGRSEFAVRVYGIAPKRESDHATCFSMEEIVDVSAICLGCLARAFIVVTKPGSNAVHRFHSSNGLEQLESFRRENR